MPGAEGLRPIEQRAFVSSSLGLFRSCTSVNLPERPREVDPPERPLPREVDPPEAPRATYLCDAHVPDEEDLPESEELGMYAETDGCECDGWR